jgi:gas vesicle protein
MRQRSFPYGELFCFSVKKFSFLPKILVKKCKLQAKPKTYCMEEKSSKKDHFWLGLLVGASVGAVLGVLFAPNEGKVTRKKLTYQLKKMREQLLEFLKKLKEGKEEHISMAKTKGEQVVNEAKNKAETLLKDVENLMEQIKHKE